MSNKKSRLELANFCAHQLTQLLFDCVHDKNGNLGGTEQDLKTVEYMLNIVEDLSTRLRIAIKYSDVFFKKKITDEASHTDEIATQQQK